MLDWFRNLFANFWDYLAHLTGRTQQTTVLLLGIENAGKSTLMFRLKEDKMTQPLPTMHPTSDTMTFGNLTFKTYDLGGHKQVRRVWKDYLPVADAIIYVIDSANPKHFEDSRTELNGLLGDPDIVEVPIAILLNKVDLHGAIGETEAIKYFNLHGLTTGKIMPKWRSDWAAHLRGRRPLEIFPCSILNRFGYGEAIRWMAQFIK